MPPQGVKKGTRRAREEARKLNIRGRSTMSKAELERAGSRKRG